MLRIAVMIIASALLLGSATAQPVSTRIALVIGNTAYTAVAPLPNAVRDAAVVRQQLVRLGFDVEYHPNLNRAELGPTITAFGQRLRAAGPNAVSFIYYAGHAAQDELGVNYLVPTDATARTPDALREEATPLQVIFADMTAANNPVNVLVLDACRDWYAGARGPDRITVRGLRDLGRHDGNIFVGLATTPGNTTSDGAGDNSPYTTRLVEALQTKANQPLSLVFDDIATLVYADTDGAQAPIYTNGLVRAPRWCLQDGPNCGARQTRPSAIVLTNAYLRTLDRTRLLAFTNDNVTFVDTLLSRRDILSANGIDTPARLAHFLAAVGHETAGFRAQQERFPRGSGVSPEVFANRRYANRIGNGDEASGDGWRYRGRGLFMLTGRGNYRMVSPWVGVDLETDPDLLTDPEVNLAVAAAFWNRRNFNAAADADDLERIGRMIGGAPISEARRRWVEDARAAVAPPT